MTKVEIYAIVLGIVELMAASSIVTAAAEDGRDTAKQWTGFMATVVALQLPLFGRVFGWW